MTAHADVPSLFKHWRVEAELPVTVEAVHKMLAAQRAPSRRQAVRLHGRGIPARAAGSGGPCARPIWTN
jgi:hypothetical protein